MLYKRNVFKETEIRLFKNIAPQKNTPLIISIAIDIAIEVTIHMRITL